MEPLHRNEGSNQLDSLWMVGLSRFRKVFKLRIIRQVTALGHSNTSGPHCSALLAGCPILGLRFSCFNFFTVLSMLWWTLKDYQTYKLLLHLSCNLFFPLSYFSQLEWYTKCVIQLYEMCVSSHVHGERIKVCYATDQLIHLTRKWFFFGGSRWLLLLSDTCLSICLLYNT